LRGDRHEEVSALADELQNDRALCVEGLLIASRTATKESRFADARAALDRAIAEYPDDLETLRGRGQFLFEHGSAEEAESALQALIDHDPDDASAHHNLGTLRMRTQRYDGAVEAYRRSLSLRPHYAATHLNLGYALKDSGRLGEAVAEWEQTLRLAPGDPAAQQELSRVGQTAVIVNR
jgi:tetratricopeptide (TPR) repeat protein